WGSTFLAIRLAIDSIPPLMMMGLRCTAAGGLMLAWAALRGERAGWRAWSHGAVAGALMFGCAYGALAWAEERLASGVAGAARRDAAVLARRVRVRLAADDTGASNGRRPRDRSW